MANIVRVIGKILDSGLDGGMLLTFNKEHFAEMGLKVAEIVQITKVRDEYVTENGNGNTTMKIGKGHKFSKQNTRPFFKPKKDHSLHQKKYNLHEPSKKCFVTETKSRPIL